MIIKRIFLENIRSYTKQEVEFQDGISLLAGDIGAGKSSLLLAIDFALFGLQRGELSGSALLRNGCEFGTIELDFSIDENNYRIQRTLKKSGEGIVQDSGFLMINGEIEKLTTVELKQKVLEILNYPADSLSKKSLIYRYTVYTPQEEMKAILLADSESRLGVVRKLFDIDKYKRISANSKILSSRIKEKRKEFASRIYDLGDKKNKLVENEIKINELKPKLDCAEKGISVIKESFEVKKRALEEIEVNIKKLTELKKNKDVYNTEIKAKNDFLARLLLDLESFKKEIIESGDITIDDVFVILENIKKIENEIKQKENDLRLFRNSIVENDTKKKHREHIRESIVVLENCPTCKQIVKAEHKESISKEESENILKLESEILRLKNEESKIEAIIEPLKKELDALKSKLKDVEFKKSRMQEIEKKKLKIDAINSEISKCNSRISELNELRLKADSEIQGLIDIENVYKNARLAFEEYRKLMYEAEMNAIGFRKDVEFLNMNIEELKEEIAEKELFRGKVDEYAKIQEFIEDNFVLMVESIEKAVMSRVLFEFNNLFSTWLSSLVRSEVFSGTINTEFSPSIKQNGYDVEYENLSGGEKTATALAYRLALNQVVNNIDTEINTKDLIILDEPTDGFSPEQIEIMKDVLSQLKMKQIIIVSHEPKIESFADRIIRVDKNEHVSKISYV